MDAKRLEELAARVEALEGPDRGMDAEIAHAIDWAPLRFGGIDRNLSARSLARDNSFSDIGKHLSELLGYTASIDAAVSLVPEGWWAEIGHCVTYGTARISGAVDQEGHSEFATAKTPALALCAAALRARAAMEERNG